MLVLLQSVAEEPVLPGGYAMDLLQAVLALAAVCLLAWVALRWAARLGFGKGRMGGRIEVLERIALDPRRSLYLVKLGERVLLIGAGDGGAPSLLAEFDPADLPPDLEPQKRSFAELFKKQEQESTG